MKFDENIFLDVIGWEGFYKVNYLGIVNSVDRIVKSPRSRSGTMLRKGKRKYDVNINGYRMYQFNKDGKGYTVSQHRLIAVHFIPNPENKPFVNHINGIRSDNRIENLEWCTASENMLHAYNTGLNMHIGSRNNRSRLSIHEVNAILAGGKGKSYEKTGRDYGVSGVAIKNILIGKSWKQLT